MKRGGVATPSFCDQCGFTLTRIRLPPGSMIQRHFSRFTFFFFVGLFGYMNLGICPPFSVYSFSCETYPHLCDTIKYMDTTQLKAKLKLSAKLALAVLAVIAMGLSIACSSSSSGTVKSVNGDVSGEWQLVVDDNGHLTYVWVAFKADTFSVDSTGAMFDTKGEYCGYLGYDMALLPSEDGWVHCDVTAIGDDQLVLNGDGLTVTATRLTRDVQE